MFGLCLWAAVPGAALSFGFLRRSHLLKFAKKESLDLIHWVIFSDHCRVNLRPCNHNQLACYSHEDSSGITRIDSKFSCACVRVCTLDLCVILCLVFLALDGQLNTIARQVHLPGTWFLTRSVRRMLKDWEKFFWQSSTLETVYIACPTNRE